MSLSQITLDTILMMEGVADPTAGAGIAAPLGSFYSMEDGSGFYRKSGATDTDWTLVAPIASPAFTGTPSLPTGTTGITQSAYDNSTKLATTAYVDAARTGLQIVTSYNLNPTGGNQVNKMMGLAVTITPAKSTRIWIIIQGSVTNTLAANVTLNVRYGTGAAPTNGAAATGTTVGTARVYTGSSATGKVPFMFSYPVTGLSISTAYWVDLEYTAGTAAALLTTVDVILQDY